MPRKSFFPLLFYLSYTQHTYWTCNKCMGVYNGQMFKEEKNLKDSERKPSASYGAGPQSVSVTGSLMSYTKTNKLVTALYMVTDILDKDEPLRNKLRTLGLEILSDISMSKMPFDILKISQVLSFLDIAVAVNIIKTIGGNVTIKDIKDKIQNSSVGAGSLISYGEKTLQRELVSMVKDNVLNKVGEKRWSRYFLK